MHLSPSKILFTNCLNLDILHDLSTDKNITELSRALQMGGTYPKLQVVKKDGYYFALNDAQLKLYRYLEKVGQCGLVQVERVSLREVPEGIKSMMRVPDAAPRLKGKTAKKQKGKYHSVSSTDAITTTTLVTSEVVNAEEEDKDVDADDDECDSDLDDTLDSSDWSYEEPSATDIDTSGDEEEAENESFI